MRFYIYLCTKSLKSGGGGVKYFQLLSIWARLLSSAQEYPIEHSSGNYT